MAKKKAEETVITVKGFDKNWQCRGFQYEVGQTYKHEGKVEACSSGFHSVEYPLDVFGYYAPADSHYAICEASGEISRDSDDTKIASAEITIKAELHLPELVKRGVEWILARIENTKVETNTGDRSAATNTGNYSAATVEGKQSVAIATGFYGKAKAAEGCAICLVNRDDDGNIRHIRAAKVGDQGIKADTFYTLSDEGEFVEA